MKEWWSGERVPLISCFFQKMFLSNLVNIMKRYNSYLQFFFRYFHSDYFTKKNIYPILNQAYRKRFLNLARKCRQTGNSKNLETLSTSKVIHNTTICFSYHHLDLRDKINLKKLQIFFFVKDLQDREKYRKKFKQ